MIERLKISDLEQTLDLFCECFAEDHFYARSFPDKNTRAEAMRIAFRFSIEYCLAGGFCYGIRENEKLIAFLLMFDYWKTQKKDPAVFREIFTGSASGKFLYEEALHGTIEKELGEKVLYALSVAVKPSHRGAGLAACLFDKVLEKYSDYNIASDVSNEDSLAIYTKRGFEMRVLEQGYYLILHRNGMPVCNFEDAVCEAVKVALPETEILKKNGIAYQLLKKRHAVYGVHKEIQQGISVFTKKDNEISFAVVVEMRYAQFLQYQRLINLSHYCERFSGDIVLYVQYLPYESPLLINPLLREMLKNRKEEWSIVPDFYVSIPVQYSNMSFVENAARRFSDFSKEVDFLIKMLEFRTNYETGVPSEMDHVDASSGIKNRIKRYYLGKIKVQIVSEMLPEMKEMSEGIGMPAYVDLYISIDEKSSCAVLTWFSLSMPFLLSYCMDNIICNQIRVITEDDEAVNFFDYLSNTFGIVKRGTPKIFVIIPEKKEKLSNSQIASLLAAEAIYPEGEFFGRLIDPDIVGAVSSEYGMGQYDRGYVCAHTNVLLQFSPELRTPLTERIGEETISLFFIELLLFEEAAIHIANQQIVSLFTDSDFSEPVAFLKNVEAIYDDYSKSCAFWNIQLNYPTSQKSIDMMREAFEIEKQLAYMQRNKEQLQTVFDTKCDIIDRKDSKRMDFSLAILSVLAVFSAWIDGYDYISTWNDVLSGNVIHVLQRVFFMAVLLVAGYAVVHLFGNKAEGRRLRQEKSKVKRKRGK